MFIRTLRLFYAVSTVASIITDIAISQEQPYYYRVLVHFASSQFRKYMTHPSNMSVRQLVSQFGLVSRFVSLSVGQLLSPTLKIQFYEIWGQEAGERSMTTDWSRVNGCVYSVNSKPILQRRFGFQEQRSIPAFNAQLEPEAGNHSLTPLLLPSLTFAFSL